MSDNGCGGSNDALKAHLRQCCDLGRRPSAFKCGRCPSCTNNNGQCEAAAKIDMCAPKADFCAPKVDACAPKADVCTPPPKADVCAPKVDECAPKVAEMTCGCSGYEPPTCCPPPPKEVYKTFAPKCDVPPTATFACPCSPPPPEDVCKKEDPCKKPEDICKKPEARKC